VTGKSPATIAMIMSQEFDSENEGGEDEEESEEESEDESGEDDEEEEHEEKVNVPQPDSTLRGAPRVTKGLILRMR